MGIAGFVENEVAPWAASGLELLADAAWIAGYDCGGGVQNGLAGAIILLDAKDFGAREILGKAQDDAGIGAAPAVDGLVVVADDAQIGMISGEQAQQIVLHVVGILIFVHVEVAKRCCQAARASSKRRRTPAARSRRSSKSRAPDFCRTRS
jgi:hypothetical protein